MRGQRFTFCFVVFLAVTIGRPSQSFAQKNTGQVDSLNRLSAITVRTDPAEAKKYADQALEESTAIGYRKGIGEAYINIGQYHRLQMNSSEAMKYALLARDEFEAIDLEQSLPSVYRLMAQSYIVAGDDSVAFHHFRQAFALDKQHHDSLGLAKDLLGFGFLSEVRQQHDSSLYYAQSAVTIVEKMGDRILPDVHTLINAYNNLGSAHTYLGHFEEGALSYAKALPIALRSENLEMAALLYQNLGEVSYKTSDYSSAQANLDSALSIANRLKSIKRKEQVYHVLRQMEEARGNFKAAHDYLIQLWHLRDTLFTTERAQKVAELEKIYNTQKNEETIRTLEHERQLDVVWRNALIVVVIVITIAGIIIYRLQRLKTQKTKELLATQQALNSNLTEVDRLKSHFFASISHEFRTPLTLILAPVEQGLKTNPAQLDRNSLFLIRRNANHLLELVNQLLDLSKLEAGKMKLVLSYGRIDKLFNLISASFDSLAQYQKVNFVRNFNLPDEPVFFDEDKVEQIVTNLLTNAFKFTPQNGTVTFATSLKKENDTRFIVIEVHDTGKGIPAEQQEKIFNPFYQVQTNTEQYTTGTGLGLFLVRELLKLSNGRIEVRSEVGVGSSFIVSIPVDRHAFDADVEQVPVTTKTEYKELYTEVKSVPAADANKDTILVVEDNVDLRNFITHILQNKYTVITAKDGVEATQLARQVIPNLVLSDVMMPKVDGIQLVENIKKDVRTSHIPVVLLTAKNEDQSRIQSFKTGADDYLTKPFSEEELLVRIHNLVEQRKQLAAKFREQIIVSGAKVNHDSMDDRFLLKVHEVVETYLGDINFSVSKLATEVNMSRTQLLRKLKAITGLSPNEYIKNVRLKRAAEMIKQRTNTVTQVGYAVGFNDQSYFTKCFKKQFGVTPSEFLQEN